MDTFVDSSWYFYRYLSPARTTGRSTPAAVRYWFPIDLYVGGIEHAILHLVYSRFWTKVMRDLGLVTFDEPVTRLFPQGMVHKDGEVMSKSKGNTVAPDDMIGRYGADTLRLYILSVAPPEDGRSSGTDEQIAGVHRFLQQRVAAASTATRRRSRPRSRTPIPAELPEPARALRRKVHQTIQRVTEDVEERIQLNTAVAALHRAGARDRWTREADARRGSAAAGAPRGPRDAGPPAEPVHAPRVRGDVDAAGPALQRRGPHLAGRGRAASRARTRSELAVQVNGKVRGRITVPRGRRRTEDVNGARSASRRSSEHVAGQADREGGGGARDGS